jgi:hypothetical protein
MTTSPLTIPNKFSSAAINLIVAVVLTTFLCFIDEGYYNFNWTKQLWNWVFFVIYVASMLLGQAITQKLILKKYTGKSKTLLTSLIGIPLGLAMLFAIGFSLKSFLS